MIVPIRPTFVVDDDLQVYRYVRTPEQPIVEKEENVYIYNNNQVVREDPPLPNLDCPRNTEPQQGPNRLWCATRRGTMHGPYVAYYRDGQIRTEGRYEYGQKSGSWIEYYDNGAIRAEGEYRDGKRSGTWINYDRNGNETTTVFYNS